MEDLSAIISNCFSLSNDNLRYHSPYASNVTFTPKYMVVPIDKNIIEIPLFAFYIFDDRRIVLDEEGSIKDIVIQLKHNRYAVLLYKAINAIVRDAITMNYEGKSLLKMSIENEDVTYYGTNGAIFDKYGTPMMMCTWEIQRIRVTEKDGKVNIIYKYIRPILRIDPSVITLKADKIQKYIVNKILPTALSLNYIYYPYLRNNSAFLMDNNNRSSSIKVIIDKCPFSIKSADVPSISTINRKLLDVAQNYIDEVVQ